VAVTLAVLHSAKSPPPGTLSGFSLSPVIDALLVAYAELKGRGARLFILLPSSHGFPTHSSTSSTGYSSGLRSASTHLNGWGLPGMEPAVSELEVERNYLLRARRYLEK
jgi:hypothetical protein